MKPADFFIGAMQFFAILLPGALLVFLGKDVATDHVLGRYGEEVSSGAAGWAAFFVVSYLVGHLLHHGGSYLDGWYEATYPREKRPNYAKGMAEAEKLKANDRVAAETTARNAIEQLSGEDRALAQTWKHLLAFGASPLDSAFSWAGSFVRVHSNEAASDLERGGADSKFFRSMVLVVPLGATLWVLRAALADPLDVVPAMLGALIVSVPLAWFSWRRFCKLRWANTRLTYEYFLIVREKATSTETRGRDGER